MAGIVRIYTPAPIPTFMPTPEPPAPEKNCASLPPAVSPWAIHRRLYDWMLSFGDTRWAMPALFVFSVCESVFFPVPSLVLQIPMTLDNPKKAWRHAAVNLAGSLVGGAVGYAAGHFFFAMLKQWFPQLEAKQAQFAHYADNAALLVGGALAIHPFKFFTILAGALEVNLGGFFIAVLIGRGVLFFGVAALLWKFGAPVKLFIDRWFNWLCLALGLLIVGLVVATRL